MKFSAALKLALTGAAGACAMAVSVQKKTTASAETFLEIVDMPVSSSLSMRCGYLYHSNASQRPIVTL